MTEEKEAIVFIPGFDATTKNHYIDNFLEIALTTRLERRKVSPQKDEVKITGQTGRRFIEEKETSKRTIDIYEIYWADLIENLSQKNVKTKVVQGIGLFIFWMTYSLQIAKRSRLFTLQTAVFMAVVLLWYYGTVVMLLTAVGNDPTILGTQLPEVWATRLGNVGTLLGGWSIWIVTSIFISLLPSSIDQVVDIVDFTTRYMQDEASQKLGGLRDRLRYRALSALNDVIDSNEYQSITVLSHSLGTLISTDMLADYHHPSIKIRHITLGSPMEALITRSEWLKNEIVNCLDNEVIETWTDFYSGQDWFCTRIPRVPSESLDKLDSRRIDMKVSFFGQVLGESHRAYFFDRYVLEEILDGKKQCSG